MGLGFMVFGFRFLGLPLIRIIVVGGLSRGPPSYGKHHLRWASYCTARDKVSHMMHNPKPSTLNPKPKQNNLKGS